MSVLVAVWVMVAVPSAASVSSAAETITRCGRSQPLVVKVSCAGLNVRSASPPDRFARSTYTVADGRVASRIVYVAEPPSGTDRLVVDSITPTVSSSSSVAVRLTVTAL